MIRSMLNVSEAGFHPYKSMQTWKDGRGYLLLLEQNKLKRCYSVTEKVKKGPFKQLPLFGFNLEYICMLKFLKTYEM